jgi:hypothetical protein
LYLLYAHAHSVLYLQTAKTLKKRDFNATKPDDLVLRAHVSRAGCEVEQ